MKNRLLQSLVQTIATLIAVSGCHFAFAQAEPLHGTVITKAEKPLEAVQVVLRAPDRTEAIEEYITDEDGGFSIPMESLRPGYEIHLHKDGFEDVVLPINPQRLVVAKIRVIMLRTRGESTAKSTPSKEKAKEPEPVYLATVDERRERAIRVFNAAVERFEKEDEEEEEKIIKHSKIEAARMFRESASIDPTFPDPLRILTRIAIRSQNWAEASRYSEALIRIDPNDEEAVNNLYISLVIMRHHHRVGEAAKRLVTIDLEKIDFVESHAQEFYKNNLFVMSRALYQALTEIAPDAPNAFLNLGLCCAALGDVEATKSAYERFLELAPEDHPDIETVRQELAKLDATNATEATELTEAPE